MADEDNLLICVTCGTQFDIPYESSLKNCRICDDPRQYVPPEGQQWTSLAREKGNHENFITQDKNDQRIWFITSNPKLGIGERAIFLQTDEGNVLWDLITFIDEKTIEWINSKGGLRAIVISHPHFYTTHLVWARIFSCPVYVHGNDEQWLNRADPDGRRRLISGPTKTILPGVTAVRTGGHFDGSMVLHWDSKLFVADSVMIVPSGVYHVDRPQNTTSFAFMWSYPNMIPLPPPKIHGIWKALKPYRFVSAYGGFPGHEVHDEVLKQRLLESMKIQVKMAGWDSVEILNENL